MKITEQFKNDFKNNYIYDSQKKKERIRKKTRCYKTKPKLYEKMR